MILPEYFLNNTPLSIKLTKEYIQSLYIPKIIKFQTAIRKKSWKSRGNSPHMRRYPLPISLRTCWKFLRLSKITGIRFGFDGREKILSLEFRKTENHIFFNWMLNFQKNFFLLWKVNVNGRANVQLSWFENFWRKRKN